MGSITVLAIQEAAALTVALDHAFEKNQVAGTICKTVTEAIDLLSRKSFDLIILDLDMQDKNGMWALRKIREDQRSAEIPVLVIGSENSELTMHHCSTLDVADYLLQPVSRETLYQKINIWRRIISIKKEIPDRNLVSTLMLEKRENQLMFRFKGDLSTYSVIQFQEIYTLPLQRDNREARVIFNVSGVPVFGAEQKEQLRLLCEMIRPHRPFLIAGKNLGALMPEFSTAQTSLFLNEHDAMDYLAQTRKHFEPLAGIAE